jgi:hypothetical protein
MSKCSAVRGEFVYMTSHHYIRLHQNSMCQIIYASINISISCFRSVLCIPHPLQPSPLNGNSRLFDESAGMEFPVTSQSQFTFPAQTILTYKFLRIMPTDLVTLLCYDECHIPVPNDVSDLPCMGLPRGDSSKQRQ